MPSSEVSTDQIEKREGKETKKGRKEKRTHTGNKLVGQVVIPGDVVASVETKQLTVGPGLRQCGELIVAEKAGILRGSKTMYYIDSSQRRYLPVKDDRVIGAVLNNGRDAFQVDIRSAQLASLPYLSFEGVTKKNRPDFKTGDLVYTRVLVANKDMEPELSCVNGQEKADGMGILTGGFSFQTSLGLCHRLLRPKCTLVTALGEHFPYEMTVGLNGIVWVKAETLEQTIIAANATINSEFLNEAEIKAMVKKLCQ
ncbi:hypothetical protein SARC_04983 [Sphaeroforma arctica JP610]|uniref:Ribosomal RNA-processing protein 40 n=1 Tax=Sphaeroforma arctica JP610 TaxID=667725 RepID=A0A0L0G0V2_9EUKA|nr:hypothetical protein SARC_04983 [Sphaeroforma arctica JP610]KNC82742.1 hypothetical protein SARC_04983 [Sphaeroforma arctica JP610]|eukprot:XP_014156644.1 hypothetical protein SARC_04983 [Sphaeroforma arctica JP610]